ncbi:MAG: pilus assembly PilX family protein [Symbiobacteriia bacterium]
MKSERGASLILALLVTLVAMSLGLAVLTLTTAQLRIAAHDRDNAQALSAAEAGVNLALDRLAQGTDPGSAGSSRVELVPGIAYEVFVTPETNQKKQQILLVTAAGYAGSAQRRLVVEAAVRKGGAVQVLSWNEVH